MTIYEPREHIEVDTPKGRGRIWLVTEYGFEIEKVFTVILNATGEMWEFRNNDIRATKNRTGGRGNWDDSVQSADHQDARSSRSRNQST